MLDVEASRTQGEPEWWLMRLGQRLYADRPRIDRLDSYWRGDPPMPSGNARMREAYKRLQRIARTNFGSLVAETVLERLKAIGFRSGGDATDEVDKEAWSWWQANSLDADSGLVHRAAVVLGRAYVIVGEDPDEPGKPLVTVEDPRQVIHECSPTNRRKVIASLKSWWDDVEGCHFAVVFLKDEVHYFRSTERIKQDAGAEQLWQVNAWDVDTTMGQGGVAPNPFAPDNPVVPFINRPNMAGDGLGEFEDVIDVLDRINSVILDRLVISAMQAYRQRWAKGISMTDEDGNDTHAFDPGADLLWAVEDEAAQFGEFSALDLTPIIKSVESDVQHLASITRTPPSYMLAGIVNASGDALAAAEVGLVSKCTERCNEFGESWERVYRLVGKQQGKTVGPDAETIWRDPQFRSLSELASASVQLKSADVPWRTRMRLLDFTPAQIERMEAERAHDLMMGMMAQIPAGGGPVQPGLGIAPPPDGPPDGGEVSAVPTLGGTSGAGPNTITGNRSTDNRGRNPSDTGSSWRDLYARAKAAGVKGAAQMTKAELLAAVGG